MNSMRFVNMTSLDVIMMSALPFIANFWQIRNKDVKVGPCSKLQLLKLPCFRSLIIEI